MICCCSKKQHPRCFRSCITFFKQEINRLENKIAKLENSLDDFQEKAALGDFAIKVPELSGGFCKQFSDVTGPIDIKEFKDILEKEGKRRELQLLKISLNMM